MRKSERKEMTTRHLMLMVMVIWFFYCISQRIVPIGGCLQWETIKGERGIAKC